MNRKYRLQNSAEKVDGKQWSWTVWVEGSAEEMLNILSVTYILHTTFANPKQIVKDRNGNFSLKRKGWGEFMIRANIRFKDESSQRVEHWLSFDTEMNEKTPVEKKSDKPRVFLSYSLKDQQVAERISEMLSNKGITLSKVEDIPIGVDWSLYLDKAISSSDAVVTLTSNLVSSSYQREEIEKAKRQHVEIYQLEIPVQENDNKSPELNENFFDKVNAITRHLKTTQKLPEDF